ncbi:MAG TPA: hypothetical protein VLS90_07620, partial [Thermodesulfobacteriota bacterium]|nr:hypothetical protein [Thermodesulfobacteriota bacterium]
VAIVQEGFVLDAKASGEAFRLPNPTIAVTPLVFTSLTPPQTRQEVDKIIDQIIAGLTTHSRSRRKAWFSALRRMAPRMITWNSPGGTMPNPLKK